MCIPRKSKSVCGADISDREEAPDICSCERCVQRAMHVAAEGDVVTIDLDLVPEHGFVPEPLFDTSGRISFVVGWGNYLPGVHELVKGKRIGEGVSNASVDAGWGERDASLIVKIPREKLERFEKQKPSNATHASRDSLVGSVYNLSNGIQLSVVEELDNNQILVDANPPLAGSSYSCSFSIVDIQVLPEEATITNSSTMVPEKPPSSRYAVSTWALGCFWGGELAFMRCPGVVGTRVGYSQGTTPNPTYEQVCTGKTHHREAIMVVYDPEIVSFRDLVRVALERLKSTKKEFVPSTLHDLFAEDEDEITNKQYQHGFFYHSPEQEKIIMEELSLGYPFHIDRLASSQFYEAEEYHQQYLLKGGQSARKGAKEVIRCYG